MSQWTNVLDIKDIWKKLNEHELDVSEGATLIADKIKKELIPKKMDEALIYDLESIVDEFECVGEDDVQHFDYAMGMLYDWADTSLDGKFGGKKVAWIATNF